MRARRCSIALAVLTTCAVVAHAQTSDPPATSVTTGPVTTLPAANGPTAVSVVMRSDTARFAPALETVLDGKVPGATIESSTSDAPGGGMQILLHGLTSILSTNAPLFVVDGVIIVDQPVHIVLPNGAPSPAEGTGINRIADIDPNDIERIEVLSGAAATAIYGSKAPAGAVIITTKRGSPAGPHWALDGEIGHALLANELSIRRFPTVESAQRWYVNDATRDTSASAISKDNAFIRSIYAGPQNYQAQLFGNPEASYAGTLSASGTAGTTQYYASAISRYGNGVALNTGDAKQSLRANVTQHIGHGLSLSGNVSYVNDLTRQGAFAATGLTQPYQIMSYTPGFVNLNHENASGAWTTNPFGPVNPFADEAEIYAPAKTYRFIGGGSGSWTPWHGERQSLQIVVAGGVDHATMRDPVLVPPTLQFESGSISPDLAVTNSGRTEYSNYSGSVIHHVASAWIDATTSAGYAVDREDNATAGSETYPAPAIPNGPGGEVFYAYHSTALRHAFYGQEQILTLRSRLALTAGATAETSTLNGDPHHPYVYSHYAASYRVPLPLSWLDEIKLRGAYGQAGNPPSYGTEHPLLNVPCVIIPCTQSTLAAIKPETERETELGFDAPMFHTHAQLSATIYYKQVSDLLVPLNYQSTYGFVSTVANGGVLSEHGAELELSATPLAMSSAFTWTSTTTYYRNYSVVGKLMAPISVGVLPAGLVGAANQLAVGRSATEIVDLNETTPGGLPLQIGDALPSYEMSFGNAVTLRRFRIYGLVDWSRGGTAIDRENVGLDLGSLAPDSALAARRVAASISGRYPYAESGTYLTLRQLVISYDVPKAALRRVAFARLSSARLSLTGYDLWSSFKYRGVDPQADEFGNYQGVVGFEGVPYPPARSYFLGLQLGI